MVVVVEVVVVVLRGARAHEEGEHEGEEENADGGGTRGTSGKHGVYSVCVRRMVVSRRFLSKRCRRLQISTNQTTRKKPKSLENIRCSPISILIESLNPLKPYYLRSRVLRRRGFQKVPFNKRVLSEEQTVATLLVKTPNFEEPEQREVDFSLS